MDQERKYRKYSKEFRESALRRWEMAANVSELCQELGISRTLLYWWRDMEQREQEKQSQAAEQRLRRENTHLLKVLGVAGFSGDVRFGLARVYTDRRIAAYTTHEEITGLRAELALFIER